MLAALTVVVGWQFTGPATSPATIPPLAAGTPHAIITDGADEPPGTDEAAALAAAEAAVEAWGRFATSGDVSVLKSHFDPAGPQYRQMAAEAPDRARDRARYRLTLTDAEARPEREDWIVDGEVRMTRDGRPAGRWRWRPTSATTRTRVGASGPSPRSSSGSEPTGEGWSTAPGAIGKRTIPTMTKPLTITPV